MLEVRDLKVSFRSEQGLMRAIDGVSFNVGEGEILGMVGESGSGKTVSLLAVMGTACGERGDAGAHQTKTLQREQEGRRRQKR